MTKLGEYFWQGLLRICGLLNVDLVLGTRTILADECSDWLNSLRTNWISQYADYSNVEKTVQCLEKRFDPLVDEWQELGPVKWSIDSDHDRVMRMWSVYLTK